MLCICNLLERKRIKGSIKVMGIDVSDERLRKVTGIVFQNPDDQVFSATVFDDVAFGLRNMCSDEREVTERVERILKVMGIKHLANRNPANLSGGEKKKVAIAGVLAMEPKVILIDEPTAGLDHSGVHEIFNVLTELNAMGKTIVITTHDSEFAFSWADRIAVMNKGKVVTDNLQNQNLNVKIRLPGKEKVIEEMRNAGILSSDVFESLRARGLEGSVVVRSKGSVDYCYGIVDFERVKNPEFDLDLIAIEAHRREVSFAVSEKMLESFVKAMSERNCKIKFK